MWKKLVRDYFTFTKKERIAVLVLVFIMVSVSIVPYCFPPAEDKVDEIAWRRFMEEAGRLKPVGNGNPRPDTLSKSWNAGGQQPVDANKNIRLFSFDPNTLPPDGWKKLGLRDGTIRTIRNYVGKGGRFNKPEDIGKIYGLPQEEVKRLQPYVRIVALPLHRSRDTSNRTGRDSFYHTPHRSPTAIDINSADTTTWIKLPGIGAKLASRIVQFRKKLGGFHSVSQVSETYGLADSVYQKIHPWLHAGTAKPVRLNLNTAGIEELKQHPYLRWQLANAIVQYRQQHGPFRSIKDLQRLALIDSVRLTKLLPYLAVD